MCAWRSLHTLGASLTSHLGTVCGGCFTLKYATCLPVAPLLDHEALT